jgi:hypothetical protein
MPKQQYQIKDFSGGLNNLQDPRDIMDNQASKIENLTLSAQGMITPAVLFTNSISEPTTNTNIADVQAGYGLGYFETDRAMNDNSRGFSCPTTAAGLTYGFGAADSSDKHHLICINDGSFKNNPSDGSNGSSGDSVELSSWFPDGSIIRIYNLDKVNGGGSSSLGAVGIFKVVGHNGTTEIRLDKSMDSSLTPYWGASIQGVRYSGVAITLLAKPSDQNIDIYSEESSAWSTNKISLSSYTDSNTPSSVKYYKHEDSIRCCDTNLDSQTKIKWFGFISRVHFADSGIPLPHLGFFSKDNDLAIPTNGDVTNGATTYPTAGNGFDIRIDAGTEDSTIEGKIYEIGESFIYDGNQESLLRTMSGTYDHSSNDLKSVTMRVTAAATLGSGFNERVSGGRIYIKEQNSDDEWTLLVDIDLSKGIRTNLSDDYSKWENNASGYICPASATGSLEILNLSLVNYEIINGFPSSIFSNDLGHLNEKWQDAVISNNRVFICNVQSANETTGTDKSDASNKNYPDKIMYSMLNRYDTFPSYNYIEVAKGDPDKYIAIDSYADRLLVFKTFSMDIINISSPDDANWFLEDTKQYMGVLHPEAVKRTQYGLIWANAYGLYLYNGQSVQDLTENKIDPNTWKENFSGSDIGVVYDELNAQVFVIDSLSNNSTAYMCDLKKGIFTTLSNLFSADSPITNFVDTESNNTLYGQDGGSTTTFGQFHRSFQSTTGMEWKSKEFDFGDPSRLKKFYKIYMTYKSSNNISSEVYYSTNSGSTWTAFNSGTSSTSTTDWIEGSWSITSPVTTATIMIKVDPSVSGKLWINDITLEYRTLHKRHG